MAFDTDIIHYLKSAEWKVARFGANNRFLRGDALLRYIDIPFFEGMDQMVAWLMTAEGCADVFVDRKRPDVAWMPLRAWYEDSGTSVARTWRLYHALRNAEDSAADGPYTIENGCTYKVSHTFYWSVAAVMEVPESSSGVHCEIQGIRLDEDSGRYSYVLVKRERVAVNVGPWLAHQDQYETREQALLLGLRDEPESSADRKIADFAAEHGLKTTDGEGVVVDVQKSKNDDCTTDATLVNSKEEDVPEAATVISKTAFEEVRAVTQRGQKAALEMEGLIPGTERRNEKTPGGRFQTTEEIRTPTPVSEAETDEQTTLFETSKSVTDRNQESAELPPSDPATDGEKGIIEHVSSALTNESKYNNRRERREERKVLEAEVAISEGALSKNTSKLDRNLPENLVPSVEKAVGKIVRRSVVKTPGDLRDVRLDVAESIPIPEGEAGETCAKDIFAHQHSKAARNQPHALPEAPAAGEGKSYRNSSRLNEDGTFDTERTENEELKVPAAAESVAETAMEDLEEKEGRNLDDDTAALPEWGPGNSPHGSETPAATLVELSSSKTPGGRKNIRRRVRKAYRKTYVGTLAADPQGTIRSFTVFRNLPKTEADALVAAAHSASVSPNGFDLYDGTTSTILHAEGGRQIQSGRKYKAFEATSTATSGRIVFAEGTRWKVTETIAYVQGILHDNDPSGTSQTSAFAKVDGMDSPRVQNLGNGYWSYYGVKGRRETWKDLKSADEFTETWGTMT